MAPPSPPTGPSSEEISSQAKAFQQLTAVLLELGKAQQLSGTAARGMRDGMSEVGESFKELEAALKKSKEAARDWREDIKESIEEIEDFGDAANVARKILKNLAKENKNLATAMVAGAGAIKGFAAGFKLLKAAATSVIGVIRSIGSALFDLGAAILSAPFKMLEGLIGMAKEGMGSTELAQAFENVREVFGDVSKDAGGSVIKLGTSLTQGMIGPGLSAIRVFGTLSEAIEYANKVASASPVLFDSMRDQFEKNGKSILAMSKGLGIAEEDFTGLMSAAKATGREIEDIEVEIAKYAKGLSAQFGLNSKLISRDMGKAMKDVKHFANSTVQEIAKASTYAHGLGLELKDITGVLDAFNTFDQAAENVSKLSQAFGVNIDTMKLLEAKTPDDALAMLKDSLAAAGKSADTMNRQELQLLASTVGMSEEAVRQSFSLKNQGIAHNKVTQAAKGLEAQSMSTSEAISSMTNDIVRAVKAGPTPESNSLWGMFFDGFLQGITRTGEFRTLLANLRKDFYVIIGAGRELGVAFVEAFPGFKEILEGLADVLSPQKIGGLFNSFKDTFKKFFEDIRSGTGTVKGLMEALQGNFTDYLTKAGPGGQKLLQGLHDFWEAAKKIIVSAIDYLGDMMKDAFNAIADAISGKYDSAIGGALGGVQKEVSPIITALGGLFEKIKGPLARIFDQFFDWIGEKISAFWSKHWGKILAVTIGPSIVGGLASVMTARLAQGPLVAALNRVAGLPGGAAGPTAPGAAGPGEAPKPPSPPPAGAVGSGSGWKEFGKGFGKEMAYKAGGAAINLAEFAGKAAIAVKAMSSLMDLIKEKKLTEPEFKQVMAIVEAMMSFYTKTQVIGGITGALNTAASRIPISDNNLEAMGKGGGGKGAMGGFAALAVTIIGMLVAGEAIIHASKQNFDVAKLKAVAELIEPISNMFLKAIVVAGASSLLGAAIASSAGLGAAAIGVGLMSIGVVVSHMISTAEGVLKAASNLKGDGSQIKTKAEAVAVVIESVSNMLVAISKVISSLPMNMFSGTEKIKETFSEAGKFVSDLLGTPGGSGTANAGGGITGLLNTLSSFADKFPVSKIAALSGIASVFGGIGQLLGGVADALSHLTSKDEVGALFGLINIKGSSASGDAIFAATGFIDQIMVSSEKLINSLKRGMAKVKPSEVQGLATYGQAMSSILSSLSSFMNVIVSAMQSFKVKTTSEDSILGVLTESKSTIEKIDVDGFSEFAKILEEKIPGISGSLSIMISSISGEVLTLASSLTPEKIEGIKTVVSIMGAAATLMASLQTQLSDSALKGAFTKTGGETTAVRSDIQNVDNSISTLNVVLPSLSATLKTMSTEMPTMIKGIIQAVKGIDITPKDITALNAVSGIFKTLSKLIKVTSTIMPHVTNMSRTATSRDGQGGRVTEETTGVNMKAMQEGLKANFESIASAMEAIVGIGDTNGKSPIKRIVDAAGQIPQIPAGIGEKLKSLSGTFTSIKDMVDVSGTLNSMISTQEVEEVVNSAGATKTKTVYELADFKNIAGALEAMADPSAGLDKLVTAANKLGTTIDAGKIQSMATAANVVKSFFSQVNVLSNAASFGMKTAIDGGLAKTAEEIKSHIGAMAKAMAEFQGQIDAINVTAADNINIKMGKVANGLGVKDANYSFTKNGVTLKFNMNVFMDTKQVSAEVSKSGTVIYDAFEAGFPGRVQTAEGGTGVKVNGAGAGNANVSGK